MATIAATIADRQHFPNHSNFTVNINGTNITVTVTASASVADEWIHTTVKDGALDLFHSRLEVGLSIDPDANTLHLCVGVRCLIFQLSRADRMSINLSHFISSLQCKIGGFWNGNHRNLLYSKHRLVMERGPMDLRWLKDGLENLSTEGIIYECLGFRVELKEEIRTSDWSQEKLSDDQVLYACVESYCAWNCGVKLDLFIYSRQCKFGGFWNGNHRNLLYSKHGLVMNFDPMDLRWLKDGLEYLTTEGIIHECLGFKVELKEEIRKSDWGQKNLSDDQVLYACLESYCALKCGVNLNLWYLG